MTDEFDLKVTATGEQIASAVFGSLVATVNSIYTTQILALALSQLALDIVGALKGGTVDPTTAADIAPEQKREKLTEAYETVIGSLPPDSPFRRPLEEHRDRKLADVE